MYKRQVPGLSSKADDSAVVHDTGNETIGGIKTFTSSPVVPDSSFAQSKVTNLTSDLANKANTADVLLQANDLSDLNSAPTARTNLGLGSAALSNTGDFDSAGTAASAVSAHEADTTNIHGIADTSVLETTTGSQAKVDTHVNDTTNAHAASSIGFTPAGTISSTDVQAAIEEVATEAGSGLTLEDVQDDLGNTSLIAGTGMTKTYNDVANTITLDLDEPFTGADRTKLDGVESGATADQSDAEIKTAYENNANTNAFTDAEQTKLAGVEAGADVTDETNVKAALDGMTLTDITTPDATDKILIQDTSDSNNLKYADFSEFGGGGGATTIDDLTDVDTSTTPPTDGQVLAWNDANSEWEPQTQTPSGVGSTVVSETTSIALTNTTPSTTAFEQWGTEEAVIPFGDLPSGEIIVDASINGLVYHLDTGSNEDGSVRLDVSFDGGSTWVPGDTHHAVRKTGAQSSETAVQHRVAISGTPTADVHVRAMVENSDGAGDYNWTEGFIYAIALAKSVAGGGGLSESDYVVRLNHSGSQSIPATTFTTINWSGASYNPVGMWDSGQAGRITIPAGGDGLYIFTASINFETASGDTIAALSLNGSLQSDSWMRVNSTAAKDIRTTWIKNLVAGDYVEFTPYQDSGATRNTSNRTSLQATRLTSKVEGGGATTLDDLTDVDTSTTPPTDGQVLAWNDTNSEWEPGDVSTTATVGTQLFIPGRPQGTLDRSYNFDSGVEGWTTVGGGSLANVSGMLQHTAVAAASESWAIEPAGVNNVVDGELCLDLIGGSPFDAKLLFRATDTNNAYIAIISNARFAIVKRVSGVTSDIISRTETLLDPSVSYRIMIRFVGPIIKVFVDDTEVITVEDTSIVTGGRIGSGGYNGSNFRMDNIKVYSLPANWEPSWDGGSVNVFEHNIMPEWRGFDIDVPKLTSNTPDDDFLDTTLDPKWTVVNGVAGTVSLTDITSVSKYDLTSMPGTLLMQTGGDGTELVSLRQDYELPDGKSLIASFNPAMVFDGGVVSNQHYYKFTLNDNDTSTNSGNYTYLYFYTTSTYFYLGAYDGSSGVTTNSFVISPHSRVLLRFARAGLTYRMFFSITDGKSWNPIWEKTVGSAYTNIWLTAENNVSHSHTAAIAAWDWVREGSNAIKPWESDPDQAIAYVRLPSNQLTGSTHVQSIRKTDGDVTVNWASYQEIAGTDLSIDASPGDILEISLSSGWSSVGSSSSLDVVTKVNGSIVNYASGSGAGGSGVMAWVVFNSERHGVGGSIQYTVTESDISNGNVNLKLVASSTGSNTLKANSAQPLDLSVKNLSNISIDGINNETGPIQLWEPDAPPINPHSFNDEFTGALSTDWEKVIPSGSSVAVSDYGVSLYCVDGNGAERMTLIRKTSPMGDFSVYTKIGDVADLEPGTYYVRGGLIVEGSNGNYYTFGPENNGDSNAGISIMRWNSSHANTAAEKRISKSAADGYYRIRYRSGDATISFDYSSNGIDWLWCWAVDASTNLGGSIAKVGFGYSAYNTVFNPHQVSIPYIRFSNSRDYTDPVYGRKIATNTGSSSEPSYSIIPSWKGFDIDAPKAVADLVDDNFDTDALATKWTATSGAPGTVNMFGQSTSGVYDSTSKPNALLMQASSGGVTIRQDYTIPDGSCLIAKVSITGLADSASAWNNNEMGISVALNDNDTSPTSGAYIYGQIDSESNAVRAVAYASTGLIGEMPDLAGYSPLKYHYYKIARSGTSYTVYVSFDGHSWNPFGTAAVGTVLNNVWISYTSTAGTVATPIAEIDWVRQGTNSIVPWTTQPDAGVTIEGASIRDRLWLPDQDNPLGLDDEFDDDSIDPSWITAGVDSFEVVESAGSLNIKLQGAGGNNYRWHRILKPIGSLTPPFYIEMAYQYVGSASGHYPMVAPVFTDGIAETNKIMANNNYVYQAYRSSTLEMYTNSTTYGGTQYAVNMDSRSNRFHTRLIYTAANTWRHQGSPNGVLWTDHGNGSRSFTITPTHIGMAFSAYGMPATGRLLVSIDYFRVRQGLPAA